jgi:protease-4
MKFLRNLFASIFGTLIAFGVIFMMFFFIAALVSDAEVVQVNSNSVLEINTNAIVKDFAPKGDDPFAELMGIYEDNIGLNEILNAIENAKYDSNIEGISIQTLGLNAGISQTKAIRNKIEEFKETGKFVMAYSDVYDQKSYYLASVADSVFVNPVGSVDFKGLSSEVLFYKDLQEKTGVKMEVIRHGKYKSAVEPFLSDRMSDDNRDQISTFIQSIWDELVKEIAQSRGVSEEKLNNIADNLLGRNSSLAIENSLIDKAIYLDEYVDKLKIASLNSLDKSLKKVKIQDYILSGKGRLKQTSSNRIAVIYAQGEIIYGKGNENYIGQDLIINALKKARESNSTKAIVLRINSPGGSALASELILREIELTKQELPVVVSMGDVAASGGYYLACKADRIFAEPTTITGSIGVYGTIPNMTKLAENIGINAEQINTNKGASYSVFEPMTDAFRLVTTEGVEQVYTTFITHVAEGRNMSVEDVNNVAQGRVWSGTDALKNGLVDELGSLEDAINYAANLAELDDFRVRNYPSYKKNFEDMLTASFPFAKSKEEILIEELGYDNYKIYESIKLFSKQKGIQARIPFVLDIK